MIYCSCGCVLAPSGTLWMWTVVSRCPVHFWQATEFATGG